MHQLENELSMLKTTIEDMELVTILLNSPPYMYHNFVTLLCVSSRIEVPSFAELVGLLIQKDKTLKKDEDQTNIHRKTQWLWQGLR